jgi:hypothetical protein
MIRLDFPGYSGADSLQPVEWDDWFESFDNSNLALVVQEKTARGQQSNFNKLIGRETAGNRAKGNRASRRHPERGRKTQTDNVRNIRSSGDRDQRGSSRGSTRGARTASARGQHGSTRGRAA